MSNTAESVAKSVDLLARYSGITNKELADMLNVSESRMSLLMNGKAAFSIEQLFTLADYFGVTPSQLRDGFQLVPMAA